MEGNINPKIESGLTILARIIVREEIKRQLAKVDKLVIFPSSTNIFGNGGSKNINMWDFKMAKHYGERNKIRNEDLEGGK